MIAASFFQSIRHQARRPAAAPCSTLREATSRQSPCAPVLCRRQPRRWSWIGAVLASGALALAAETPGFMRFSDLQWREVRDRSGQKLGDVSDVLPEMPSGRIGYLLVKPAELFALPKAIPAGAVTIPAGPDAPLTANLTADDWANAPRLDWSPKLLVKDTARGPEIFGHYQPRWPAPAPTGSTVQFVSLSQMVMGRVNAPARMNDGFVRDFLIDWSAQRATHAVVSPVFTARPAPDEQWFAVPVAQLAADDSAGPFKVTAPVGAITSARPRAPGSEGGNDIFLIPATSITGT